MCYVSISYLVYNLLNQICEKFQPKFARSDKRKSFIYTVSQNYSEKKNCRLLKVPGTHFLRCHNFFQPQFQMGAISVGPINARLPTPLSCFLLPANLVINCWLPRRSLDASIYIKSKQTINLLEVRRRLYVLFMHIRSVRAYQ